MDWNEFMWGFVGFILTVMVLSYLIGDNLFFRLASSLFVGLTAGYLAVVIIREILAPYLWDPLVYGSWTVRLWTLIPLVLIVLLLISQFSPYSRLGALPLAFLAGLVAALTIGGAVFGTLVPQVRTVIGGFSLQGLQGDQQSVLFQVTDALIMLLGTVTTLAYFHFGRSKPSQPQQDATVRPRLIQGLSKIGQLFIGITFGAVFAGVFSSALLALISRIAFMMQFISRWIGGN